jgi:hypothetical protein
MRFLGEDESASLDGAPLRRHILALKTRTGNEPKRTDKTLTRSLGKHVREQNAVKNRIAVVIGRLFGEDDRNTTAIRPLMPRP